MYTWRTNPVAGTLGELQEALSGMLEDILGPVPAGEGRFPRTEVRRTTEGYEVLVGLPGVTREEVTLSLEGRTLVVEGERQAVDLPPETEVIRRERPVGRFRRTVELPEAVDNASVRASMRDGLLRIELPRRPEERPREIRIEVEEAGQ